MLSRLASLAVIAFFVAACQTAQPVQAPRATTVPAAPRVPVGTGIAGGICYLVSDAEIASIMGRQPIAGGSGFELGGVRHCNWSLYFDPVEYAGISLSRAVNHETQRFDSAQPVAGLGEDAYWGSDLGFLSVKTGEYAFTASVVSESSDPKTAAIAIARVALQRLP